MRRFAYDDQLASIPTTVRTVLAEAEVPHLGQDQPIIFSGIGTSLHAARIAAQWIALLTRGRVRPHAIDAHDLGTGAAPIAPGDQVVIISHRGTKLFPTAALISARAAGAARTVAIVGKAAPAQVADHTVRTCANEIAGTFSVSYVASLAVLAKMAAPFEEAGDAFARVLIALPDVLERTLALALAPSVVEALSAARPLLITGFSDDFVTAQEAALKIKEGAWMWTEAMSPEFALHGTPAAYHPEMGAIVIQPGVEDGRRSEALRDVLSRLGLRNVVTCSDISAMPDAELGFCPPPHRLLRPIVAILPFHRLTAELARMIGTDPDTLHGNREPWKSVMTGLRL
jgi:glutamine---fructose-6-phosphate transaminase (isomerizing)